jgi:serine protease Do
MPSGNLNKSATTADPSKELRNSCTIINVMTRNVSVSSFVLGLTLSVLVLFSALGGALADRLFVFRPLDRFFPRQAIINVDSEVQRGEVVNPLSNSTENAVVNVAEQSRRSVVTVSVKRTAQAPQTFSLPGIPFMFESPQQQPQQRDIGTGFVVSQEDGLVVSNKHVVSDVEAEYILVDSDGNEYVVEEIYRDPVNDLAILQTSARLPALPLANSDEIKVGQTVIAIGTALGEFRQTVTTGVVSGLGRGIDASDGGFSVERIDNLIQTDAAINPGNSGGPLINISGQVIGVNVAMAQAENIGFAIPINVVKDSIQNFNQTGRFERPMLGVHYKLIPKETALLNDVPEGAYVMSVVPGSSAEAMGIQTQDIIIRLNNQSLSETRGNLAGIINKLKVGDSITVEVWRAGETLTLQGNLKISKN